MTTGPLEIYQPRAYSHLGTWAIGAMQFKVYGLVATSQKIDDQMQSTASDFIKLQVLDRIDAMGDSNGLGFVVIHPGDLGLTISAHWWVQGSVLCQHNFRKLYSENSAMDTGKRPVIGCVWELALINAEQDAWRKTMMTAAPDRVAYLAARPFITTT